MSEQKSFHDHLIDFLMGSKTFSGSKRRNQHNQGQDQEEGETPAPAPAPEQDGEFVKITYKPGMTFGQALLDHNLATEHGLWGEDGDVNYYNQQLHDAGIYGNIPIGTTITLRKRGTGDEKKAETKPEASTPDSSNTSKSPSAAENDARARSGEAAIYQPRAGGEPGRNSGEYVEYTYKPGDTFGQVILDNGLATEHGLWGKDGDVAFYDQQLHNNYGIYGNIPIGTKLRLRKRNTGEHTTDATDGESDSAYHFRRSLQNPQKRDIYAPRDENESASAYQFRRSLWK